MRTAKQSNYVESKNFDIKNHIIKIDDDLRNIFLALQGRIRVGTGTDGDMGENIEGQFQVLTTNGVADTEDAFAHDLGVVPIGYIVLKQDKAGSIYTGGSAWTSTNIYLRSDIVSVTATILVIK